jgi:hypothetical protein
MLETNSYAGDLRAWPTAAAGPLSGSLSPTWRNDGGAVEVSEGDPAGAADLEKIDHVVVVMLENRSFDHMLGYLSLSGRRPEIDGLRPGLANEYQGRAYPVHHLAATAVQMDPDHSAGAIDRQIANGTMSGFVASAAATLAAGGVEDGDPGCVMGYYDGADVPVYDHLAEQFAVCDRWFVSVPGATLPNRLYALSGAAAGSRDDRPGHVPPLYHQRSFVRHLAERDRVEELVPVADPEARLAPSRYGISCAHRSQVTGSGGSPGLSGGTPPALWRLTPRHPPDQPAMRAGVASHHVTVGRAERRMFLGWRKLGWLQSGIYQATWCGYGTAVRRPPDGVSAVAGLRRTAASSAASRAYLRWVCVTSAVGLAASGLDDDLG